jgi:hypothetical protein
VRPICPQKPSRRHIGFDGGRESREEEYPREDKKCAVAIGAGGLIACRRFVARRT